MEEEEDQDDDEAAKTLYKTCFLSSNNNSALFTPFNNRLLIPAQCLHSPAEWDLHLWQKLKLLLF